MIEQQKRQPGAGGGTTAGSEAPTQDAVTAHPAAEDTLSALSCPANLKAWEDRTLEPEARLQAYKGFVLRELQRIGADLLQLGEGGDRQAEIKGSADINRWRGDLMWLRGMSAEDFCKRIDGRLDVREALGKNFLGAEAWRSQGIEVGEVPSIPASISKGLLESDCPLHPGEKIKDTHLLVLVPKTVNGEPYTALECDELCATRKGSGEELVYKGLDSWKKNQWASAPQSESEWVLIPKRDPDPSKVTTEKHFRNKDIAAQQQVHNEHYQEYREVKTLELMTAVLLHDLVNTERLLPEYVRCQEQNALSGRVCLGHFLDLGLEVSDGTHAAGRTYIGRGLARKL